MNQNFLYSLEIMWKGMAGIFIVIIIIALIVLLLTKLTARK
jgi:Na+-transporting methylmalonyl-CoA/oxaloacetate decarboxylase gamma subunit